MSTEVETVKAVVEITPLLKTVWFFANLAYSGVLIWGLKNVSSALKGSTTDGKGGVQAASSPQGTGWNNMLRSRSSTINGNPVTTNNSGQQSANPEPDISYARVSGAIGSIAIASLFVGMSYWILYALFFGNGTGAYNIAAKINSMGGFFIVGAALFLPYAFERLSSIFKV